jgi:hypothetical protein
MLGMMDGQLEVTERRFAPFVITKQKRNNNNMKNKIEIVELSDKTDCETCGSDYATGFSVKINGDPFGIYTPYAHCYNRESYTLENVLLDIIKHLGYDVDITSEGY